MCIMLGVYENIQKQSPKLQSVKINHHIVEINCITSIHQYNRKRRQISTLTLTVTSNNFLCREFGVEGFIFFSFGDDGDW